MIAEWKRAASTQDEEEKDCNRWKISTIIKWSSKRDTTTWCLWKFLMRTDAETSILMSNLLASLWWLVSFIFLFSHNQRPSTLQSCFRMSLVYEHKEKERERKVIKLSVSHCAHGTTTVPGLDQSLWSLWKANSWHIRPLIKLSHEINCWRFFSSLLWPRNNHVHKGASLYQKGIIASTFNRIKGKVCVKNFFLRNFSFLVCGFNPICGFFCIRTSTAGSKSSFHGHCQDPFLNRRKKGGNNESKEILFVIQFLAQEETIYFCWPMKTL